MPTAPTPYEEPLTLPPREPAERFQSLGLEIKVSPGTDIDTASRELVAFADFLGLVVTAKFNGVTLMAHPGGFAKVLADNWHKQMESGNTYKIAVSYVR